MSSIYKKEEKTPNFKLDFRSNFPIRQERTVEHLPRVTNLTDRSKSKSREMQDKFKNLMKNDSIKQMDMQLNNIERDIDRI